MLIEVNHLQAVLLNEISGLFLADLTDFLEVICTFLIDYIANIRMPDKPLIVSYYLHSVCYFVPVLPKPPVLSVSERSSVSSHWTVSTLWNVICAMRVPALMRNFQDALL